MEAHVFLTQQAVRSIDGITAFSALPDAPVLPYKPRRRRSLLRSLARQRADGGRPVRRFSPASAGGNAAA